MKDLATAHAWVRTQVRRDRFEHIQRVAGLATSLAEIWGSSKDDAALAAMIHDCARDKPADELLSLAGEFGIPVSAVERRAPILLHAPVGAELARRELGITDDHILDAVRFHATGRSGMTLLEKIIFIADYAEPGRTFAGVEGVRTLLRSDLDGALRHAFDLMIMYLIRQGWLIHPDTVAARNDLYMRAGVRVT